MNLSSTADAARWWKPAVMLTLGIGLYFVPARRSAAVTERADASIRVGLVFDVGGRGDKSFNDAAYEGLVRAGSTLPVTVTYMEPSGTEDREAALRLFAARGYDLVIGVGFIFSSDINAVARDYPKTRFAGIDYFSGPDGMPPNVAALAFREEEGSFLVGALAGLTSKSHHVGFIGGMTGPLIRKFEVGYAAGVHEVCAECTVNVAYAGATPDAYHDPAKGKALTSGQIGAGVDIVYHASGSTGHGVFEAASEAHIFAIGVDSDQYDEMPGTVLSSMTKRADVAVFDTIEQVTKGHFEPGMHVFGLREGGVDYVHDGLHGAGISPETKARIERLRLDVVEGRVHVPRE